jgi:hypothetical protein
MEAAERGGLPAAERGGLPTAERGGGSAAVQDTCVSRAC